MTKTEQAIHDLVVQALLFEPELQGDYPEGEREIKRHDVLEQALLEILEVFPATTESQRAREHVYRDL